MKRKNYDVTFFNTYNADVALFKCQITNFIIILIATYAFYASTVHFFCHIGYFL